jgi:putative urate catabolism protein
MVAEAEGPEKSFKNIGGNAFMAASAILAGRSGGAGGGGEMRYVRDMRGYGSNPPDAGWPGGAHVAVQFVVNYEEGGENCVLHGDAASEAFLSEVVGAQPWPGMRHWNMESIYEYGARAGFWRLHRMFTAAGVPATCYGVATALARSPDQVAAMQEAGWEIASHGLKWIDYRSHAIEDERRDLDAAIALHAEVTGERPLGLYVGRTSDNSVRLAAAEGGFAYISDTYDDDLPYWLDHDGHGNPIPAQLVIPYTLDANDMRFATAQGFNTGDHFFAYLKDAFDTLYAEGRAGRSAMMSVGLHCRLAGRPGRAATTGSGCRAASTSPPTGGRTTPTGRRRSGPRVWTARLSSPASAASSSIRRGSPNAPSTSSSVPPTTAPAGCTTRCAASSARRRKTRGWACSRPIPTSPASSPRPSGSPPNRPPSRPRPASTR